MRSASSSQSGSGSWRTPSYTGLFFDTFAADSAWIRETGCLNLPPEEGVQQFILRGEFRPHPDARGIETRAPTLDCRINGIRLTLLSDLKPGVFEIPIELPAEAIQRGVCITLTLGGTRTT